MRVLMVGATGRHAHQVLRELTKRGVKVRALVRNDERAQVARRNGAEETVIGDLTEPASLNDAVAGRRVSSISARRTRRRRRIWAWRWSRRHGSVVFESLYFPG
jgi:uncharacterized protein YbjT (DUF2867 family)